VRLAQEQLRGALPKWSEAEFEAYAARHTPAYWLKTDEVRRVKQAHFVHEADKAGRTVTTSYETDQFRDVTEFTVLSPDHPRLLAVVTGACAAAGGNIVDAQIFTTTDGMALDTIVLSRAFDRDEDELRRAGRVAKAIERALKGEVKIADLVESKKPSKGSPKAFHVPPEVTIDNSLSSRQTVIEVSGLDRPGLLYDLTTALGKLNLNIASAHIVTFGEKAVDVFYVTDLTGTKVTHAGRQSTIRRTLLDVFKGEEAEPIQRRSA
jgi:[protein-PII] uridylyltransferase